MNTHFFDWYKIVDAHPVEAVFEKRKLVVDEIIKLISKPSNRESLAACISGVSRGFETLPEDTSFIQEAIKLHQTYLLSFPSRLSDNALELRVASAIALGEVLARGGDRNKINSYNLSLLTATLLLSALGMSNLPTKKYLAEMIVQLKRAAEDSIETSAQKLRTLPSIDYSPLTEIAFPLDEASYKKLITTIQNTFTKLEQQATVDREELEILWWYQNGISTSRGLPLIELSLTAAAIRIGVEVAERVIFPYLQSTISMIRRAVEKDRKRSKIGPKTIEDFVKTIEIADWTLLTLNDSSFRHQVEAFPSLLPLSWLGTRIKDSEGTADPMVEFEKRTQIVIGQSISPADFAVQIFREQIAKRNLSGAF